MHVAALALAQARLFAEDLRRHPLQVNAFGNGDVMGAVRAGDGVGSAQVGTDANGHRLLAGGQVHLSWHRAPANVENGRFAFHIHLRHGFFKVTNH